MKLYILKVAPSYYFIDFYSKLPSFVGLNKMFLNLIFFSFLCHNYFLISSDLFIFANA